MIARDHPVAARTRLGAYLVSRSAQKVMETRW